MGAYRSTPLTDKHSTSAANSNLGYGASEMQGWRVTMEDAKITHLGTDFCLFGVFDGHGGHEVAHFVERHFVQELAQNRSFVARRYERALAETFLCMDELLLTTSGSQELRSLMGQGDLQSIAGCTSVVTLIVGNRLYAANAGDSRAVLARGGRVIELTTDHKPDMLKEKDRIMRAGGKVEEGRVMGNINLSRSIGDFEYKQPKRPAFEHMVTAFPEVRTVDLTPQDDFLVLACDGVWDMVSNKQCIDFIYERLGSKSLDNIVEELLDRCLAPDITSRGGLGCDNMTCIIVAFIK
jgi:protein phosphatase 1G